MQYDFGAGRCLVRWADARVGSGLPAAPAALCGAGDGCALRLYEPQTRSNGDG